MFDMREMYEDMILDHNRNPRNFGVLEPHTHEAYGYNPICGDEFKVFLEVENGVIKDLRFDGVGCAVSTASISLMTQALKGKTQAEALELFERMHKLLTGLDDGQALNQLGKLQVLKGVCDYPTRIKCAVLPWHTLKAALKGEQVAVNTEGVHLCDANAHPV
jgi:nitrogen fixation NifU-like protein